MEHMVIERKQAAHRKRSIIYNNDGGDVYRPKSPDRSEFLKVRTSPLLDTHVDTIFYCTRSSGFGLFTHNTDVGEIFTYNGNQKYANNIKESLLKKVRMCWKL